MSTRYSFLRKFILFTCVIVGSALVYFNFVYATWTEDAKILPSDGVASQGFGYSVDVSGDYAIVGVDNQKKAYIFHFEDGSWVQQAMFTTSTGSTLFAENVAIAGDYAMVTDHNDGSQAGAVFVYKRTGSSWDLHQRLVSSDLANQDFFGDKLAMAGEYAIIGAYREDQDAAGANTLSAAGSAYIFKRDGSGVWSQQQKIVPTDRAADDWFGRAVDISESGDYVLVGAPNDDDTALSSGSAYVFYRTTSTWAQQAKLNANDPAASDFFGNALSISDSGEYVVVGAYSNDDAGSASGSGYVFVRSGVSWSL
ncbi:MAG: FG-GAP repeat protein, partial [Candidatus Magasanikbacteria bacterium]|nr:FG-GAP repeat protein [Candidatus Magasanikbacteria bacterium]